jgi:hypothetical protein
MKVGETDDTYFAVCIRRVDKADACSVVTAQILLRSKVISRGS